MMVEKPGLSISLVRLKSSIYSSPIGSWGSDVYAIGIAMTDLCSYQNLGEIGLDHEQGASPQVDLIIRSRYREVKSEFMLHGETYPTLEGMFTQMHRKRT